MHQSALLPWPSTSSLLCPSVLRLSSSWDLLGPFQIGTREAEWGADPLEFYGGFRNLSYSDAVFRSALPVNGTASWSRTRLSDNEATSNAAAGTLKVQYAEVDWQGLQQIYGWAALQFQAWARGTLYVCSTVPVTALVYITAVGEFYIDGTQYFGGDFYSYRRAPVVVELSPGKHTVEVRVAHDIRSSGSGIPPAVEVGIEVSVSTGGVVVDKQGAVLPDVVEGRMVGEWGSVPVRNEGTGFVEIAGVSVGHVYEDDGTETNVMPIRIAPGQTRPVKFRLSNAQVSESSSIHLSILYRRPGISLEGYSGANLPLDVVEKWHQPQKYTFLHPSGIVSYAVLRPPSPNVSSPEPSSRVPILLALHGAGVDVRDPETRFEYDELPDLCAWLVIPQGVTAWSGDDWHNWGLADAEAAIDAIPQWMRLVSWKRQGVDLKRWVVSGHSNGGQGVWYTLAHRNDKIIAAAPLSAYMSIKAYVPYPMWRESDPQKVSIILSALSTYSNELFVENTVGTPLLQQHGQEDDNVPIYHARRMSQLIAEAGWTTDYYEMPDREHWWDGAMTDGGLPEYLKHSLEEMAGIPTLPEEFQVVVANPGDMGARGGIIVDQLAVPGRMGRVKVKKEGEKWELETANIRRFHLGEPRADGSELPKELIVDGQNIALGLEGDDTVYYTTSAAGDWAGSTSSHWRETERAGKQLGSLSSMLNSHGTFNIIAPYSSSSAEQYIRDIALDVARNLYQYFAADTVITDSWAEGTGNAVLLGLPWEHGILPPAAGFPITKNGEFFEIKDAFGRRQRFRTEPGMGIVFLHPLPDERLLLCMWGTDEQGLRAAARLLPLRTGVGQPDVILVGKEARWSGIDGVMALGMLDSQWQLAASSYV